MDNKKQVDLSKYEINGDRWVAIHPIEYPPKEKIKTGKETRIRTFVKTLIWRTIASINAAIGIYWLTGDLNKSIKLGIGIQISGLILYYIYERYWNDISWGRE